MLVISIAHNKIFSAIICGSTALYFHLISYFAARSANTIDLRTGQATMVLIRRATPRCYVMKDMWFVPLLLLLFSVNSAIAATELDHGCRPDLSYANGSQVEKNIDTVLRNLVNGSFLPAERRNSIVGQSPDRIYGIFQCRGDTNSSHCKNCATDAHNSLGSDCLIDRRLGGKVWMDLCFLRFENTPFIGVADFAGPAIRSNTQTVNDSATFGNNTQSLLQYLSDLAVNSASGYAAGSYNTVSPAIYGLVQCWNYLPKSECSNCLQQATEFLVANYSAFTGAKRLLPNCMAIFDTTKFFYESKINPSVYFTGSPPAPTGRGKGDSFNGKLGVILGATGAAILFLLVISCCYVVAVKKKQSRAVKVPHSDVDDDSLLEEDNLLFSMKELVDATNNFADSNKLGQGGFGQVYKGTLPDGKCIAVKKLTLPSAQGNNDFFNEIKIVANLQHKNLVNLLGCCLAGSTRMLVYEYMPNGNLENLIFGEEGRTILDWPTCYNIIVGVAKGLLYLHVDSKLKIIHRDIKPSNILLDDQLRAKIADFGIAKLFSEDQSRFQTRVAGTFGYIAPEYAVNGQLSIKADVYSFGVVILEILSGKHNSDSFTSVFSRSLLGWAWRLYQSGNALDMVDESLIKHGNCQQEQVGRCIHIALLCVQADETLRPTMMEVVMMLSSDSVCLPIPTMPAFLDNNSSSHSSAVKETEQTVSGISAR